MKPSASLALPVLFRQLAAAQRCGVPAHEVAALLATDAQWRRGERRLLEALATALKTQPLADALATRPKDIAPETAQLLRAAQAQQCLPATLDTLADDLREQAETHRRARAAMDWPLVVALVVGTVLVNLSIFVLPAFDEMYTMFNAQQEAVLSRAVLGVAWVWVPVLAVVTLTVRLRWLPRPLARLLTQAWGRVGFVQRHATHGFSLRLLRWLRFTHAQGALHAAALAHLKATTIDPGLAQAVHALAGGLQQGASPAAALDQETVLPRRLGLLARLGERFGDLDAAYRELEQLTQSDAQLSAARYEQGCLLVAYSVLGLAAVAAVDAIYLPIFRFGTLV